MSNPDTTFVAEPGQHDMTITATIAAPRDAVYQAFVDPDLVPDWWGPAELTSKVERYDATSGGSWRIVHVDPAGNEYGFNGVFHAVTPDRIVRTFEFEGMPGHVSLESVTFEEVEGGTRVVEHAVFQTVEDRDGMADTGARDFAPVGMAQLQQVAQRVAQSA